MIYDVLIHDNRTGVLIHNEERLLWRHGVYIVLLSQREGIFSLLTARSFLLEWRSHLNSCRENI